MRTLTFFKKNTYNYIVLPLIFLMKNFSTKSRYNLTSNKIKERDKVMLCNSCATILKKSTLSMLTDLLECIL